MNDTIKYLKNLTDHKALVGQSLTYVIQALTNRAILHDYSKFSEEEFEPYMQAVPRFEQTEYGSEEYKEVCKSIEPAIKHHLSVNRHHPEYFPYGINDMNLLDMIEMVCDWIAAARRVEGDKLRLDLQKERFKISDQLYEVICNTAEQIVWDCGIVGLELVC